MSGSSANLRAVRAALAGGQGHWGRQVMAVLAIALGTALGAAVNLINGAAVDEFAAAANQFGGAADLTVSAGRDGFSEALYPQLAHTAGIATASPVVDLQVPMQCLAGNHAAVSGAQNPSQVGPVRPIRLLGLDVLRAARIDPASVPPPDLTRRLLEPGQALLSTSAAQLLDCHAGDPLRILRGADKQILTVAGVLADAEGADGRSFALLDVAYAQESGGQLGRLQRIDVRLAAGQRVEELRARVQDALPMGVRIGPPEQGGTRTATLSRAYRANLTVLALIALFTGAFLVFTTQTLAVARRRARIGLLRALGVERHQVLIAIASESLQVGLLGASLGVVLGTSVAAWALQRFGGDLGAGYFSGSRAHFTLDLPVLLTFLLLGTGCALAGCVVPAWQAARADPAIALQVQERGTPRRGQAWLGGLLMFVGGLLCRAPALSGLPLPGYAAIALLLIGVLLLLPMLTRVVLGRLPQPAHVLPELALTGLRARSREAALSLATIVVAVSLVAAMLVMIGSFRLSLSDWLNQVLPADIYVRGSGAVPGLLEPGLLARLEAQPGVAGIDALRTRQVLLRDDLPAVALIARTLPLTWQHQGLAVVAGQHPDAQHPAQGCDLPCAWVSEAMVDLYHTRVGDALVLPLDGQPLRLRVAGIWRDYARQFGAVVIDRADYQRVSGDRLADDAALYLQPGTDATALIARLQTTLDPQARLELAEPRTIKALSLQVFDRSFTVTYALEAVALVIGLLGISAGFGAQVLARRREFGVLVHLGASRGQILGLIALEGALVSALGVLIGLLCGGGIGLVLIRVVNRQSFHWSMDLHVPWGALAALGAMMLAAATAAALLSARDGLGADALQAVREDA